MRDGDDADLESPADDRFEREFGRSFVFGPIAAVVAGVAAFLLALSDPKSGADPLWGSIAFGIVIAAYMYGYGRLILIRLLISKRGWTYTVKRLLFGPLFLAPLAVFALGAIVIGRL